MTLVGSLHGAETRAALVFPVAHDGKPPRRRGKLCQQRVERRKTRRPIDCIAGDHDEVGLRVVELLEQLPFERSDTVHVHVADLHDAESVAGGRVAECVVTRHEPPWRDCQAVDRGR